MQILKVDCGATIPPGVMSVTCPEGHEIWRGEWDRAPLESLPTGSTLWVSVEDFQERVWSGVPKRALN